jgi:hypothetical protein
MKNERTAFTESKDTVVEKSDAEMHGHLGLHDDLPQGNLRGASSPPHPPIFLFFL